MYHETAELYDLVYGVLKDYAAESAQVAELLRRLAPACRTVLDVACGTAEHAKHLGGMGFEVDGIDLDPAFVRIARAKNPGRDVVEADMTDFRLARHYDAVICLFSSIAYVRTLARVVQALRCFRAHAAPGGVIVVEPWFAPGRLDPQRVTCNVAEGGGVRVERTSRVEVDGRLSRIRFDYEIADGTGTRHASEVHELGLFTTDEMHDAFLQAGLEAQHDPVGLTGRGLFVART